MVGTDVCQFLGGAGGVQRGADPHAGLDDREQPPLEPAVTCLLVRRDRLLCGVIGVLESQCAQCDRHRVDQLRVLGEAARLLIEQMEQIRVDKPMEAQEIADLYAVLSKSAGEIDGRGRGRDLGTFGAALKKVQNDVDVFGQDHWSQNGYVLVLPHLGKLAAQALRHHFDQVVRSGLEPSGKIAKEGMGVDSHTSKCTGKGMREPLLAWRPRRGGDRCRHSQPPPSPVNVAGPFPDRRQPTKPRCPHRRHMAGLPQPQAGLPRRLRRAWCARPRTRPRSSRSGPVQDDVFCVWAVRSRAMSVIMSS